MASEDLINFDVIESQKENIQAIPSGRSAKKLAELLSPSPLQARPTPPNPSVTKGIHEHIRAEYEAEIANLAEADDPLDVFDRYVRWTLDAYPSAQATQQSQLHLLLERATRQFVSSAQYKNDPRYLRLWLHYIQLFADSPRETFVYLSRHGIADQLAGFYEEYAAWLEGAGRWAQAEEVFKLGIEREARPQHRLLRKFGEFEQRREKHRAEAGVDNAPSSPALPTVRPALGAKLDPFAAAAAATRDPQAPRQNNGLGGQTSRPAKSKSKLAIFSDANADTAPTPSAMSSRAPDAKGWDNIGSLADRKKENVMAPKPMAGETLRAGGKKSSAPKMAVFRDTLQVTVAHNGKKERVFVDLRAVYPTPDDPGTELSFEELWAANRGWLDQTWEDEDGDEDQMVTAEANVIVDENSLPQVDLMMQSPPRKLAVHSDVVRLDENGAPIYPKEGKAKKKKVVEVNATQIIKAKLDSPSGPKIKKRQQSAEPTMTLHTKAATDDIYDIFNAPLKTAAEVDESFLNDNDYETDDYTTDADSTGTTRNINTSEVGDEEDQDQDQDQDQDHEEEDADEEMTEEAPSAQVDDETSDVRSVSEWSDFSTRKHVPRIGNDGGEDVEGHEEHNENDTQLSDLIDMERQGEHEDGYDGQDDAAPRTRTIFVPIPPEDYVPPTRPYRDPVEVANNRLPFMTPITERTETSLDITDGSVSNDTPSKRDDMIIEEEEEDDDDDDDDEALEAFSSPLREVASQPVAPMPKISLPLLPKSKAGLSSSKPLAAKSAPPLKGPIIHDAQCNPVDDSVRNEILEKMQPPLSSYDGFFDHRDEKFEKGGEIRRYAKAVGKGGSRSSTDKTGTLPSPVVLQFPDGPERKYTIRNQLGAGAFAPVYLVENSAPTDGSHVQDDQENDGDAPVAAMGKGAFALAHHRRSALEALKMEDPPTAWEFHMMRLAHTRVGPQHRAAASLSPALELRLYRDECFLFLPYHAHGTLLDVVNLFRSEPAGTMDETLAMFFVIEVVRTAEALHGRQLMHGDLKVDNCLLRLPSGSDPDATVQTIASQYRADGSGGWAACGLTLIDFGRAIDMRAFNPDVQFIADWKTTAQDCAEMREGRPWTWQIDYHGLAGIVHCLLFGKYIETIRADTGGLAKVGGAGRRYRIRENLKRYWQTDIWSECFDVLLNPAAFVDAEEGARMPVLKSMRAVRERMETWLEGNCERGVGLRSLMVKVEHWVKTKGRR